MGALVGMKSICDYTQRSESTVLGLIRDEDFPAAKIKGIWESSTEMVDKWRVGMVSSAIKERVQGKKSNGKAAALGAAV